MKIVVWVKNRTSPLIYLGEGAVQINWLKDHVDLFRGDGTLTTESGRSLRGVRFERDAIIGVEEDA